MNGSFAFVLLLAFGASCVLLIVSSLREKAGILQFPFLAGCGLLGFLFPQAVGIVRNPEMVPGPGLLKALLMCTLCALAVYFGWHRPVPREWIRRPAKPYPVRSLYWIGILLLAVGLFGYNKLTALSGGVTGHYSAKGNYALTWSGAPVIYNFFAQYLNAGLVVCGIAALLLGARWRFAPPAVVVAINLATIVFLGRRSNLVEFLVVIGCIAYFGKRILPPRKLALCGVPLVAAAMFLAPEYRKHSQIDSGSEPVNAVETRQTMASVFAGTPAEYWTLVHLIQITDDYGLYSLGTGFYNAFVAYFVPKLIVGEQGKESMFIPVERAYSVPNEYGFQMSYGMVSTGPGTAYMEFWFPGCLLFYFLSRLMRYLWVRADLGKDLLAQCVYTLLATSAVAAVVNDIYGIYNPIFMFWAPLELLVRAGLFPARAAVYPHGRPLVACEERVCRQ